jgi:hypothetical protein
MTFKYMYLFSRRDGMSPAEFSRHYVDHHAPLAARTNRSMRRYRVDVIDADLSEPVGGRADAGRPDAVTSVWTEAPRPLVQVATMLPRMDRLPPATRAILDDHVTFIAPGELALQVREEVLKEGAPMGKPGGAPKPKAVILVSRDPGVDADQFGVESRSLGADALRRHPGIERCVHNAVIESSRAGVVDAVVELVFPGLDGCRAYAAGLDQPRSAVTLFAYEHSFM